MTGKAQPPLSSQPTPQEWTVYLHWFCPVKHSPNPQTTSSTRPILLFWGITEPFVFWDEMTKSGGLVRLLTSRSQHLSLSRLESFKVGKYQLYIWTKAIFFIRTSRSATLCQDAKCGNISLSAKIGFLEHFFNDKKVHDCFRGKRLIEKLVRIIFYTIWSFQFFSNYRFKRKHDRIYLHIINQWYMMFNGSLTLTE